MKSFLTEIAEAYLANEPREMIDYCFIFPNKRSETFFIHEMAEASRRMEIKAVQPATSTISDFIESFSDGSKAERLEMIFILFQAYKTVLRRRAEEKGADNADFDSIDFNKFQYWADVILGDFNDVDMFLVEPRQLFINVERLREISANYLTEEQREAIMHFWKEQNIPPEAQSFWNHSVHFNEKADDNGEMSPEETAEIEKIKASAEFLRLWQVIGDVYDEFRRLLQEKGLFYSGMAYRKAVDDIKERRAADFWFKRYIFVGFNMLSKAEWTIMNLLKEKTPLEGCGPMADFYWDLTSPAFNDTSNTASYLLKKYAADFPSVYNCLSRADGFPDIEIIGLPSRTGQAKLIGEILHEMYPGGEIPSQELRQTAIVLPDETLTVPMLRSIPKNITPLNITMGYRLRNTSVAGLIRSIVTMQMHERPAGGIPSFYYEDVKSVLAHPMMRQANAALCDDIILDVNLNRWYTVPAPYFDSPEREDFKWVFSPVSNKLDPESVFNYLDNLLHWLGDYIVSRAKTEVAESSALQQELDFTTDEEDEANGELSLASNGKLPAEAAVQWAFVMKYADAVKHLRQLYRKYLGGTGVFLEDVTVFNMVERLVAGEKVNFEGKPLRGLQVMGVLETRSLDFDTLILPSMNERIFPRKHYAKTFIPNNLRSAYGMSTTEHQESIYAYYFYRMIGRAKKVYLIYDARTSGTKNGAVSRYIYQLLNIFKPENLSRKILSYPVTSIDDELLVVAKDKRILREIERFRSTENPRYLSASSINLYINCPMAFYLQYIEGYKREDLKDYIDESTYGTIVHEVLQNLYDELKGELPQVRIDRATLDGLKKERTRLERLISQSINRNYRTGKADDINKPLTGDGKIFAKIIYTTVEYLLEREKQFAPFYYIAGESKNQGLLTLRGSTDGNGERKELKINFFYCIDRIDRLIFEDRATRLRIIDYKTGDDATTVKGIDHMFADIGKLPRAKAALQLYLYSEAFSQFTHTSEPIQPMLYILKKIAVNGLTPLVMEEKEIQDDGSGGQKSKNVKNEIFDYHEHIDRINDRLIDALEELFDPEVPFEPNIDDHACKYCAFTGICRSEKNDF